MTSISQKIVLLGEGCVGKSSIVYRYVKDSFEEQHIETTKVKHL